MPRKRTGGAPPDSHLAGEAIRDAVRTQIRTHEPPEAGQAYRRLRQDGHSDRGAVELIAAVLATEIFHMMTEQSEHDPLRYAKMLRRLPELPYDSDA